jgi:protein-disulfide isomerase-like protein with CxxC motif
MAGIYGALGIGAVTGWCAGFCPVTRTWAALVVLGSMALAPALVSGALVGAKGAAAAAVAELVAFHIHTTWRLTGRPERRF